MQIINFYPKSKGATHSEASILYWVYVFRLIFKFIKYVYFAG